LIAPFNINVSGDTLSDGYIVDFNGNQHIISFNNEYKGTRSVFLNVLSSSMIWNPIGWCSFFIKGKEAVIPAGFQEQVLLLENVEL